MLYHSIPETDQYNCMPYVLKMHVGCMTKVSELRTGTKQACMLSHLLVVV